MILDVPYIYQAMVRRPRKRNGSEAVYRDVMPVEIKEASSSEAPVVVTFPDPEKLFEDKVARMEVRTLEGRLYKPHQPSLYSGEPHTHRDVAWLKATTSDLAGYGNPLFHGTDWKVKEAKIPLREDAQVAEVLSNEEDAVKAAIRAKARDILVVDGMVWEACQEPVLKLESIRHDGKFHVWVAVKFPDGKGDVHRTFNVNELEWLRETNAGMNAGRTNVEFPDVDVAIPEALGYPATRLAFVHTARSLLQDMKGRIEKGDVPYFTAYASLRDALPAYDVPEAELARADLRPLQTSVDEAEAVQSARLASLANERDYTLDNLVKVRERMESSMPSRDEALVAFGR